MGGTRPRYARHSGAVFSLKYHVRLVPEVCSYRRLIPASRRSIGTVAAEYGFTVHAMEVMPDHVHLFIAADPTRSVAEIVNRFKGRTSRLLQDEFKSLRSRLPTLWSRSSFAATVGAVSEATIRRYIEAQKGAGRTPKIAAAGAPTFAGMTMIESACLDPVGGRFRLRAWKFSPGPGGSPSNTERNFTSRIFFPSSCVLP